MRLTCGPGRPIPAAPASPCRTESARVTLKLVGKKRCGVQGRETNKHPTLLPLGPTGPSTPGSPGFPWNTRLDVSLNCRTEAQLKTGANKQFSLSLSHILSWFPVACRPRLSSFTFGSWHGDTIGHCSTQGLAARASITLGTKKWGKNVTFLTNKISSVEAMHYVPGNTNSENQ